MKICLILRQYHAKIFSEVEFFQTTLVEKIGKHILHSVNLPKIRAVYKIMFQKAVQHNRPLTAI